jgi:hypothetical protein
LSDLVIIPLLCTSTESLGFAGNSSNGRAIETVFDESVFFWLIGCIRIAVEGLIALTWLIWKRRSNRKCPFVVVVANTTGVEISVSSNEKHAIQKIR